MKIVHIGASDDLAGALAERLGQDGHETCLVSDQPIPAKWKNVGSHRFFRMPRKREGYERLLRSLAPDVVVFSGMDYMEDPDADEAEADVRLLGRTLRVLSGMPDARLVLLSSTEVYGNTDGSAAEADACSPEGERGMRFLREEQLVDEYRRNGLGAGTLRASQLYSSDPKEGGPDFLSRGFTALRDSDTTLPAPMYQPLHVEDLAGAVGRMLAQQADGTYNVTGGSYVTAQRLTEMLCDHEGMDEQPVRWDNPTCITLADSGKIRSELGWEDHHDLGAELEGGSSAPAIRFTRASAGAASKGARQAARSTIISLALFAAATVLVFLCRGVPALSWVDWLALYVVAAAASLSMPQTILACALASGARFAASLIGTAGPDQGAAMGGAALLAAEYFALGILAARAMSRERERTVAKERDLAALRDEYQDLLKVNDENVLVRNEYEERLLASDSGFPKVYALISRLMVAEPDRILMETMWVISEMVDTPTVAVYQAKAGTPWLRLVGALNADSAMEGKSWNLEDSPEILDAVTTGELYLGKPGTDEPAVVMPIMYEGAPEAVVLIRRLPSKSSTPYHLSLLQTLSLLLGDTMEKALQYEELSRATHYIEGTNVLKPEFFRDRIMLAREKSDMGLAPYCVVELKYPGTLAEAAAAVGQKLRATDCLGINRKEVLFVLLNNTGPDNIEMLRKRLQESGMDAVLVDDMAKWV